MEEREVGAVQDVALGEEVGDAEVEPSEEALPAPYTDTGNDHST